MQHPPHDQGGRGDRDYDDGQKGKWPPGSRLFLGNLASEKTSKEELYNIFSKYGPIVSNIALRKSFGFVQFETTEQANAAMEGENGRIIGGLRVDIKLANSSETPKGGKPKRRREDSYNQEPPGGSASQAPSGQGAPKRRNTGWGPPVRGPPPREERRENWDRNQNWQGSNNDNWGRDQGGGNYNNWGGQDEGNYGNNNGSGGNWNQAAMCEVVYLGHDQGRYAASIAQMLRDRLDVTVDSYFIEKMPISDVFHDSRRRGVGYVLVVGDQNETQGTVNLNRVYRHGKPETHRNITQQEAIEMIAHAEGISLSQPQRPPLQQQMAPGPQGLQQPMYRPPSGMPPQQLQQPQQPQANVQLMEAMGAILGGLQQPAQGPAPNPLLLLTQALAQASSSPANVGSLQALLSNLQAQQNTLNTAAPPTMQQPQPSLQPAPQPYMPQQAMYPPQQYQPYPPQQQQQQQPQQQQPLYYPRPPLQPQQQPPQHPSSSLQAAVEKFSSEI